MLEMNKYDLEDFLALALRHQVIDSFEQRERTIHLKVDGEMHYLNHEQAWVFIAGIMYDYLRKAALGDEADDEIAL